MNSCKYHESEIHSMFGFIVLITICEKVRLVVLMNIDERFEI